MLRGVMAQYVTPVGGGCYLIQQRFTWHSSAFVIRGILAINRYECYVELSPEIVRSGARSYQADWRDFVLCACRRIWKYLSGRLHIPNREPMDVFFMI